MVIQKLGPPDGVIDVNGLRKGAKIEVQKNYKYLVATQLILRDESRTTP